jgi:hypothetical protein
MAETQRNAWSDQRVEEIICDLLRAGVIIAASATLLGGISGIFRPLANYRQQFRADESTDDELQTERRHTVGVESFAPRRPRQPPQRGEISRRQGDAERV